MTPLGTLVVEDVALARASLRRMLDAHRDVAVVGEATSLAEARAMLRSLHVDLVFLDIHLADGLGTTLGEEAGAAGAAVVYLTADPGFALDAFRHDAVDYLLKPVAPADLARALDRVRRLRSGLPPSPIEIRDGATCRYVAVELIEYVEAAGHYQCVHAADEVHLVRQPIGQLLARLGPGFVRAHRSLMVRAGAIRRLEGGRNGDGVLTLASGKQVRFSRSYRDAIERAIAPR